MREEILPPILEEDKMLAGLAYPLWFLTAWMTLLSGKREEPFLRFHCIQALVYGILVTVGFIVFILVTAFVFRLIPFFATFGFGILYALLFVLYSLMFMAIIALTLFYAYRAGQGTFFHIPLIGGIVDRIFYGPQESESILDIEEEVEGDISSWK